MEDIINEYVGRKVVDVLKEVEAKNVKIGADNGTAFLYCGEVYPFKQNGKAAWFEDALKQALQERVDSGKDRIIKYLQSQPTPAKYICSCINSGSDFSYEKFLDEMKEFFRLAEVKKQNIDICEQNIHNRKPFYERIVKDAYMSIDEEDCIIIIMDGVELGKYWTIREYQEENK